MNKYEAYLAAKKPSLIGRVFREKELGSTWRITDDSESSIVAICLYSPRPWQIGVSGSITREDLAEYCEALYEENIA